MTTHVCYAGCPPSFFQHPSVKLSRLSKTVCSCSAMETTLATGDDPDPDLDGEEFLERPPRTNFVRPGHLWKNDGKSEELEMLLHCVSSVCSEQVETLSDFLRKSHQEVLERLDAQDDVLMELQRQSTRSAQEPFRASVSHGWYPSPMIGPGSAPPSGSPLLAATVAMQPLFRTFEEADQLLKDCAAAVDADEAAKRFTRLQTSTGSQGRLKTASWLERLVHHSLFDVFFAWVVVTNSIFIGIEVQTGLDGGAPSDTINAIQWAYTGMFTLELILRIGGNGKSFFCSEDWVWNYLDIFVVLTSVWEKVADVILRTGGDGDLPHLSGLRALRLVRISRLVKVVRLARVLRFVMALRTLISSIIYTLKSLVWAMILLCLIVYVFAVLFTQAAGDFLLLDGATLLEPAPEMATSKTRFFGSLHASMLALFMSIAGGVSWVEVVGELQLLSTGWVFVFIFYIAFTYFAVLNVVTGVFCQSAIDSAQNDQTLVLQSIQAEKQANIEKITNLFKAIDIEETGVITYQMLEDQVNSPEVQTYFEAIGLDVWDAWSFFKLLDSDGGGAVELNEFLMGCLRLRGQARSMDVVRVMRDQAWLLSQQSRFWTYMEGQSSRLALCSGASQPNAREPAQPHRLSPSKDPVPSKDHVPSDPQKVRSPQHVPDAPPKEPDEVSSPDLAAEPTSSLDDVS
eukprot:s3410_g4.t4